MPTSEVPTDLNEPKRPDETGQGAESPEQGTLPAAQQPLAPLTLSSGGSRWLDYNTHELLEMISDLEDERRWARLREGIAWAILLHILLLSAITWIPQYVLKVPKVTDPFDAINKRKDLAYLDLPPDALRQIKPKVVPKPVKPQIDQKTLDEMKREAPPKPAAEAPPPPQPAPEPPKIAEPIPPNPQSQSQVEAPRPSAVPARPNFALQSQNPADQLQRDMQNAMKNRGGESGSAPSGGLAMHPGAAGGVQVLNPEPGVDLSSWLARWHYETERTWDPLIPDEVNPPILKKGMVVIRFRVLPSGRLVDPNGVFLEGRSGDTGLDRAAWGALIGSNYPPLPKEFHQPYLELRAYFMYNMEPQ